VFHGVRRGSIGDSKVMSIVILIVMSFAIDSSWVLENKFRER
jgi:hypothetical protein